jgi:F-type H+-transporting ATPase subunit b
MSTLFVAPVLAAGIMDLKPGLTLWTALTFLLLLVVLSKFAWKPIVKMLDERERSIRDAIEQAKKERLEAEKLLADQKLVLGQAQREAADLAHKSKQEVEVLRADLTAKARKEAEDMVASARKQIQDEKAKALAELKGQVADLAIEAARRLIQSSLDEKSQRKLVEEYIAQLPAERAA